MSLEEIATAIEKLEQLPESEQLMEISRIIAELEQMVS